MEILGTTTVGSVAVLGNLVSGNGQDGIHLGGAQGVDIGAGNFFSGNLSNGVEFTGGSKGNILSGSTISGNQTYGIKLSNSSSNSISEAVVTNNFSDGVQIDGGMPGDVSSFNTISGGMIEANLGNGVAIVSGDGITTASNVVNGITIAGNHNNGISINGLGAALNTLSHNTIGAVILAGVTTSVPGEQQHLDHGRGAGNLVDSQFDVAYFNDGVCPSPRAGADAITGNFIGTDASNNPSIGNHGFGLAIDGANGSTVAGNVISFNSSNGVVVSGGSSNNNVLSNQIRGNSLAGVLPSICSTPSGSPTRATRSSRIRPTASTIFLEFQYRRRQLHRHRPLLSISATLATASPCRL